MFLSENVCKNHRNEKCSKSGLDMVPGMIDSFFNRDEYLVIVNQTRSGFPILEVIRF